MRDLFLYAGLVLAFAAVIAWGLESIYPRPRGVGPKVFLNRKK